MLETIREQDLGKLERLLERHLLIAQDINLKLLEQRGERLPMV
jgi:hypothetical protein